MLGKKGREAELLELQKAEEAHREMLLKDRDERNKIAKNLHSLRRYYPMGGGYGGGGGLSIVLGRFDRYIR